MTMKIEDQQGMKKIMVEEEQIARLDREIKQKKKEINQIESSNTWKLANVIQSVKKVVNKLLNRKKVVEQSYRMEELEQQLREKEIEVQSLREEILPLQLQGYKFNRSEIEQLIRQSRDDGQLMQLINTLTDRKLRVQNNYKVALTYIARLYMNKNSSSRNYIYKNILEALDTEEMPEFMMRAGLDEEYIPLDQVSSYRASLHKRIRQLQLGVSLPEWNLDDKQSAYQFMSTLNIPVPTIQNETYSIHDLDVLPGTVIKPKDGAGGRGVYIVHEHDDIIDVKNSQRILSLEALYEHMQRDLDTNAVEKDEWMTEELIYEQEKDKTPARDVKFYCFYGKVGIILEIIRYPEVRHCWWSAEGKRIRVGKYDESLFSGIGVTEEELAMVQMISNEIPAPFVRIDFLRGENGLIFGEFTPKPGNYDEFDEETDRLLGDLFIEAEGKLNEDLLNGKVFTNYKEFVKNREVFKIS